MDTQTNALVVPQRAVTDMQGRYAHRHRRRGQQSQHPAGHTRRAIGTIVGHHGRLKAGDRVVAEGIQKVREGMVVNPVPFGSAPAAGSETPAAERRA